jgi:hypothetical protein
MNQENIDKIERELQRDMKGYLVLSILCLIAAIFLGQHLQGAFLKHVPIITEKIAQYKKMAATTPSETEFKELLLSTSYALLGSAYFLGRILSLWISSVCVLFMLFNLCLFFFSKRLLKKLQEKS